MTATSAASSEPEALPAVIRGHSLVAERRTWRLLVLIAIMGVMWIAFNGMTDGVYITPRNLSNLAVQAAITGVVAIGVGALLIAREIDLSVGSLLGAVVVTSVWLQVDHRWTALPTVAIAIAIGLGIGFFQGICTTKLRIPSFIVTLAGFSYLRGVAYGVTGSVTLFGTTSAFRWFSEGEFSAAVTVILIVAASLGLAGLWLWQRWLLHRDAGLGGMLRSLRPVEIASAVVSVGIVGLALWVFVSYQGLPAPWRSSVRSRSSPRS